jgi:hypothetical protein
MTVEVNTTTANNDQVALYGEFSSEEVQARTEHGEISPDNNNISTSVIYMLFDQPLEARCGG